LASEPVTRAVASGFDRVSLHTLSTEVETLKFYRSAGFEIVAARAMDSDACIKLTGDWILMAKSLK
jgi:ribosomal protein S18 acetylase RimI-like enzyme